MTHLPDQERYVWDLSDEIKESIITYTTRHYARINDYLRHHTKGDSLTKRNVADLDSAFSNVPPLTSSIIVYRGIKPNLTGEEYFSDTAFISTTKVKRLALEFSDRECCILQITVSAGSRVLPIERLSYASNEQEILFDRNGELIMTGSSIDNHNMKILYVTYLPKNSLDEKSLDVSSIHGSDVRPVENDWNDTAEKSRDENISPSEIEKSLDF